MPVHRENDKKQHAGDDQRDQARAHAQREHEAAEEFDNSGDQRERRRKAHFGPKHLFGARQPRAAKPTKQFLRAMRHQEQPRRQAHHRVGVNREAFAHGRFGGEVTDVRHGGLLLSVGSESPRRQNIGRARPRGYASRLAAAHGPTAQQRQIDARAVDPRTWRMRSGGVDMPVKAIWIMRPKAEMV